MPIDATTEVPDVEFVEIDEAFEQVKAAGFQPVLFDVQTMRPIEKQNHNGSVVAKQGMQAGTLARVGELCLLGIRVRSRETDLTEITFSDEQRPPDNLPLDVGAPFGFIPVDFTSDKPETGLGDPLEDPSVGNSEVPFTDSADGLLSNPTLDSASNNAVAETPANQATVGQTMLPIRPDPGISIDPTSEPGDDLLTAILKVAMVAILEHRETAAAPGLLGHTISTVVRRFEASCLRAIQNGSNREIPFTAILGLLIEQLDVAVTTEERQRAAADFDEFAKNRTHQTHFDLNRNGQMSDDIAIWSLNWLRRQGLYNPAETTRIMSDRLGNVVAFFPSQPITSDWIGTDALPKVLKDLAGKAKSDVTDPNGDSTKMPSNSQSGSTKPNGGDVRVSESSTEIRIPVGEKVVRTTSRPNRVRIPNKVLESTAGDAAKVLNDVGLAIAKKGKLFSHDKVVACNPDPGSWVQPQTRVELNVRRVVPNVTKMSADAAQRALGEKEFIVQPDKPNLNYVKSDVVVAQTPEAGTYASPKAKVQLTIKREVPKVEGLKVSEATTLLKEKKFSVSGTVLTLASDIVTKQFPPYRKDEARVFVDPGSAITLVEVETIVPDLAGSSLLNAKELPAARQLLDSRRIGFEFNGPTTDYPQARILKQTPSFGKRIDRSKQKVELSVVVPVPQFSTATTIGTAKQTLLERALGATLTSRTYQDSDFVLRSRVLAASDSQFRSGGVTFVRPRERVEIVVGRRIPSVAKMSWKDGLRTLQNAGFDVKSPIGPGTHIYRTEPPGQQLIDLRNTVHVYAGIQVPDVRGSEMTAVIRVLSEMGLKPVSSRATAVETADASMLGRVFVYDRQSAQNPPGGTIIPKGPNSTVKLETYTYVEERITVPQLVFAPPETRGLPIEDARAKARPLSVRVVNPTIRTLITTNRHLDNRQVVLTQSIQSGERVPKSKVIDVTVARYIYRSSEIVTYGVLPNEFRRSGGTVWTCRISGDRRTIQVGMENGAGRTFAQATGTLIDDRSNFAGERCLTYALQGGPPEFAADGIRVPIDGSGSGSLRIEGAWFDRQASWITFALKRPVFK